jgi:peroxiredoxin
MTIIVGGVLPDVALFLAQPEGPSAISTGSLFADKKAVLFALPGAFTPTCSLSRASRSMMLL